MSAGNLSVWGEIGRVSPPHLVLPLTAEPSKPRLCRDERYLNLWIKGLPFELDDLSDWPRYVLPRHYQTTFDEKSGYQHVYLHPSCLTFFGLYWQGFYFTFCTLRLAGRLELFSITIWDLLFLALHFRSVFHFLRISKIATSVSF